MKEGPQLSSHPTLAPDSLVRQKEGAQGEEEEETGGSIGTSTPGADAPTCPTRSGMSDARNKRKQGRWCGAPLHRRGLGIRLILS